MRTVFIIYILLLLSALMLQQITFSTAAVPAHESGSIAALPGSLLITRAFSEFGMDNTSMRAFFLFIIQTGILLLIIRLTCKYRCFIRRRSFPKIKFRFKTTNERESYA